MLEILASLPETECLTCTETRYCSHPVTCRLLRYTVNIVDMQAIYNNNTMGKTMHLNFLLFHGNYYLLTPVLSLSKSVTVS